LEYERGISPNEALFSPPKDVLILNAGLYPVRPYVRPAPEQKMWALATCAVLTEMNAGRHDLLGQMEKTHENISKEKESLRRWWNVENRADLIKSLEWIECGGHREDFVVMGRMLFSMTAEQLAELKRKFADDPATLNQMEVVFKNWEKMGDKNLMGWDFSRYVALCGWGHLVGYLTEDEAWEKIMPVARLLQKTFNSWEELGANYLVGREFWSLKQTQASGPAARAGYERLCKDANSPWLKYKWNMSLEPSVQPAQGAVTKPEARKVTKAELANWPAIKISGVVGSEKSASVMINGKIMKIGDVVDGATIEAVSGEGVVRLRYGNEVLELPTGESTR